MKGVAICEATILQASELWKAGNSSVDISFEIGLDERVFEKLRARRRELFPKRAPLKPKTGVVPKLWTGERIAKAAALWNEGRSLSEIATAVETSSQSISNLASKYRDQFPYRGTKATPAIVEPPRIVRNTDRSYVHKVAEGVLVSLPVVRGYCEARS